MSDNPLNGADGNNHAVATIKATANTIRAITVLVLLLMGLDGFLYVSRRFGVRSPSSTWLAMIRSLK